MIAGNGTNEDIEKLESLCKVVQTTSLCGLGQSAPNPVLSTLKYFRDEYETLIQGVAGAEAGAS
jgi:NADH:ubiquinone oxidoreductase subunit F (NADH-binding)